MKRREWLKKAGLAGAITPAGLFTILGATDRAHVSPRALRIAHLTDTHVHPGSRSESWTRSCIKHLHGLEDRPDVVFLGGDTIDDALRQTDSEVSAQWEIWKRLESEFELPIVYCIGNHDVWGLDGAKNDARYGKQWAVQQFGLKNRYYDIHMAGWQIIVLDSTHRRDDGSWYTARLDDEQFTWLEHRLSAIDPDVPILILSHIPIVCAASFFDGDNERTGNWVIPGAWVHIDARRIVELFHRHENVKLCVSGHIHLLDKVVYNRVTYYCNGAVSGNWWRGDYHQTHPGYALINLYADGSFDREYVAYGWM